MRQKMIEAYLKAKKKPPEPYAALGGEVEDETEDAPAEDAPEESAPDDAAPAEEAPEPAPEAAPAAAPPTAAKDDKADAMKAYLAEKQGLDTAGDRGGIEAAKKDRSWRDMVAGIGQGAQQIVMAQGVARGLAPPSGKEWDAIRHEGDRGVQEAVQARQSKVNEFLQANQMQRQVVQDQMTKGTYESQQTAAKFAHDSQTAGTQTSKNKVATLKALFPEETKGLDLEHFSAVDADAAAKQIDIKSNLNMRRKQMVAMADYRREQTQLKKDATDKKTAIADFNGLGKDLDPETASSRTGIGVANGKVDSAKRLMTFAHVTPEELSAADKDPKAKAALIAKFDNLPVSSYKETVSGLMAQIAPGAGSQHQLESLTTPTAKQDLSKLASYITGDQVPAGAGNLIYSIMNTLSNEHDTSQAVIDKHAAHMREKHPMAFQHDDTKEQAENLLRSFGKPAAAPPAGNVAGPPPSMAPITASDGKGNQLKLENGAWVPVQKVAGK